MAKYQPKQFVFESFAFDEARLTLELKYSFDGQSLFTERAVFDQADESYDREVLQALSFLVFILAGSSYYKSFPRTSFLLRQGELTAQQAEFFNMVYRGGLSQFLYENNLTPNELATFNATATTPPNERVYEGEGTLLMQSGGKDSLLAAELLKSAGHDFISWHMSSTGSYPEVLDAVGKPVTITKRQIDLPAIQQTWVEGGLNGHVPFSAIYAAYALMAGVLQNKSIVVAANESSADEANVEVKGFSVNHQFTKTYGFELALQDYLHTHVAAGLNYGSILRPFTELRVAELFSAYAWPLYKKLFSSCNLANYKQGQEGSQLKWDGTCPKCASTFLSLAPFVPKNELTELFAGKNLLKDPDLTATYKQLLDLSGIKPFECVGTFKEMQLAYQLARQRDPEYELVGVKVPRPQFDYRQLGPHQTLFDRLVNYEKL